MSQPAIVVERDGHVVARYEDPELVWDVVRAMAQLVLDADADPTCQRRAAN
jgi:hypothetical protein